MVFFEKARERNWKCEVVVKEQRGVMFPEDGGDEEVRSTVWGWKLKRK